MQRNFGENSVTQWEGRHELLKRMLKNNDWD